MGVVPNLWKAHGEAREAKQQVAAMMVVAMAQHDRAETYKAIAEIAQQNSLTDGLTGIPNRRALDQMMPKVLGLAERGIPFSILLMDVDKFKSVNDTHGHDAGDLVLKHVGKTLKDNCRVEDTAARLSVEGQAEPYRENAVAVRYGGEEFVVILIGCNKKNAIKKAQELRRRIAHAKVDVGRENINVTATFGIATFAKHDTAAAVLKRADAAMYAGKHYEGEGGGRNRVVFNDANGYEFPQRGDSPRAPIAASTSSGRRGPKPGPKNRP